MGLLVYAVAYVFLGAFVLFLTGLWRGAVEPSVVNAAIALGVGWVVGWGLLALARAVSRVGRVPVGK